MNCWRNTWIVAIFDVAEEDGYKVKKDLDPSQGTLLN